ncbi:MAG: hypothetical protein WCK49_03655 [Myxococcaceae bacterium]
MAVDELVNPLLPVSKSGEVGSRHDPDYSINGLPVLRGFNL